MKVMMMMHYLTAHTVMLSLNWLVQVKSCSVMLLTTCPDLRHVPGVTWSWSRHWSRSGAHWPGHQPWHLVNDIYIIKSRCPTPLLLSSDQFLLFVTNLKRTQRWLCYSFRQPALRALKSIIRPTSGVRGRRSCCSRMSGWCRCWHCAAELHTASCDLLRWEDDTRHWVQHILLHTPHQPHNQTSLEQDQPVKHRELNIYHLYSQSPASDSFQMIHRFCWSSQTVCYNVSLQSCHHPQHQQSQGNM